MNGRGSFSPKRNTLRNPLEQSGFSTEVQTSAGRDNSKPETPKPETEMNRHPSFVAQPLGCRAPDRLKPGLRAAIALVAVLLGWDVPAAPPPAKAPLTGSNVASTNQQVQMRGRVVCLAEEMHRLHQTDLPTKHAHLYGFQTTDGTFYTLLRTRLSEALFVDARLREKELILKGRLLPQTQVFDVAAIRSVRNGVVCDLFYYCSVCDIESVSPDDCACCQGPVELVEKPLNAGPAATATE
jgi:hypothetical protein